MRNILIQLNVKICDPAQDKIKWIIWIACLSGIWGDPSYSVPVNAENRVENILFCMLFLFQFYVADNTQIKIPFKETFNLGSCSSIKREIRGCVTLLYDHITLTWLT